MEIAFWHTGRERSAAFKPLYPSAPMDIDTHFARYCMQGGGLAIYGEAILNECQIYNNEASSVRPPSAHPLPLWNVS